MVLGPITGESSSRKINVIRFGCFIQHVSRNQVNHSSKSYWRSKIDDRKSSMIILLRIESTTPFIMLFSSQSSTLCSLKPSIIFLIRIYSCFMS